MTGIVSGKITMSDFWIKRVILMLLPYIYLVKPEVPTEKKHYLAQLVAILFMRWNEMWLCKQPQ